MRSSLIALLVAAVLAPATAFACGDALFRVGKGIAYRTYTAPLPANVIVVAQGPSVAELVERLIESGHSVQVLDPESNLEVELKEAKVDAIIAPYSERESIEDAKKAVGLSATYLPVAMSRDEAKIAKRSYKQVLRSDNELKHYLKAIHKVVKQNT